MLGLAIIERIALGENFLSADRKIGWNDLRTLRKDLLIKLFSGDSQYLGWG
jgi:hypothetical protein